jgi:hypothetical protein
MSEVIIAVGKEYHEALQHDSHLLECLLLLGVDEWDGYKQAVEMYEEESVYAG